MFLALALSNRALCAGKSTPLMMVRRDGEWHHTSCLTKVKDKWTESAWVARRQEESRALQIEMIPFENYWPKPSPLFERIREFWTSRPICFRAHAF